MSSSHLISAALWCLFLATLARQIFPLRHMWSRHYDATLAALCGAVALTMDIDEVYISVDTFLGSANFANLMKYSFLILCAFFLARAVLATAAKLTRSVALMLLISTLLALLMQTLSFLAIGAHQQVLEFGEVYGNRPAALVYSLSHFLFFTGIETIASVIVIMFGIKQEVTGVRRFALLAVGLGGIASALAFIVILVRDIARVLGAVTLSAALDDPYRALLLAIAFGNCVGIGLLALSGALRRAGESQRFMMLERASQRHSICDSPAAPSAARLSDEMAATRGLVLALRDAESAGVELVLSLRERRALELAEAQLTRSL